MDTPFDTLTEFVGLSRVTGLSAEHGTAIATVATISEKKDSYLSHLVRLDADKRTATRLTRSAKGESLAAIGPRGEIYFTSEREDPGKDGEVTSALWMLPPTGEARVVGRRPGGFGSVVATESALWVTAPVLPTVETEEGYTEVSKERAEAGVTGMLHTSFPTRFWDHDLGVTEKAVFVADLPSLDGDDLLTLTRVPTPAGRIHNLSASGDRVLATVETRHKTTQVSSVWLLKPGSEPVSLAAGDPQGPTDYSAGKISPDRNRAILHASSGNLQGKPLRVWAEVIDLDSAERTELYHGFDDWPGQISWLDSDTVIMEADRRGRHSLYRVPIGGTPTLLTDDDAAYNSSAVFDGRILALRSSISSPATPVTLDPLTGDVTDLPALADRPVHPGTLTEVEAVGEDGTPIRAWLARPAGADPAPLLTFVHGGPWGSWNDWTWRWNPWPFVAKGYAVLLPDPAISTGYGQAMIDRGSDELGGAPFTDLLALIAETEKRDDIDETRTAVLGGSYGGYMANWFATHTGDRFACIVTHASLWDIDMMGRTTDNGSWYEWMHTSQAKAYSPHAFADQIKVPMLVIHGDKDYRVPLSQGHALWHALLRETDVEGHQFLYYPDENHWILKPSNSALWYETVMAFVDHHVLGKQWARPRHLG